MRLECHVFFLIFALSVIATVASSRKETLGIAGGWTPINNVYDPHVTEIAQFAVIEYNKQLITHLPLRLVTVIKGYTQVVSGTNYRLTLRAKYGDSSITHLYEAIVLEKSQNSRSLTSFKRVD